MTAITGRTRQRPRRASRAKVAEGPDLRVWIDRGIEAIWLVAAVVTPLIVLSETAVLSKTSLPKVATVRLSAGLIFLLMLVDIGMSIWQRGIVVPRSKKQLTGRVASLFHDSRSTVMTSVVLLLVATALASAFALMPWSSTWGVDRGGESNSLYTTATYAVLFFAVATRLKTQDQMWRLLAAMVLAGTLAALIGIAQHFGHAPFGIRSTSGSARVSGTAGNPIFFASLLIVTMLLAIGMSLSIRDLSRKAIGWLSVSGLVIGIHLTALMVTLSRGPWIGAAVGILAIFILAPMLLDRRRVAVTGALVAGGFIVAMIFLGASSSASASPDPQSSVPEFTSSSVDSALGITRTSVGDVQSRITSLTGVFHPVTNTRITRWDGALDLAKNRPEPPSGAQPGFVMRTLFGYGPDTFPDVFTMVAPERLSAVRTVAAHNIPLNRLVETGLVGLLAWMAFWATLAFLLLRSLWDNRKDGGVRQVVTLAVGAALASWFLAGLTGIPRSGDSVLIWLLAGLAVATPRIFPSRQEDEPESAPSTPPASIAFSASALVIVGVIALGTVWVTWTETIQRVEADFAAASAVSSDPEKSSFSVRVNNIDKAIALAPDESEYHMIRSGFYEGLARDSGTANTFAAMQESLSSAERALALNPLDRDLNFQTAYLSWEVGKMGDGDAALRTYHLYQDLVRMSPRHHTVVPRLAAVSQALGLTP